MYKNRLRCLLFDRSTILLTIVAWLIVVSTSYVLASPVNSVTDEKSGSVSSLELAPIGDKQVNEGELLTFQASATGYTGSAKFSIEEPVAGMVINEETGIFSWRPGEFEDGVYQITIIVTDDITADRETISIAVNEVNTAPYFIDLADKTAYEDQLLTFTIHSADADGHSTFIDTDYDVLAEKGMAFDNATHTFSWTPSQDYIGTHFITFYLEDTYEEVVTKTIKVTVVAVNDTPVLSDIESISIDENTSVRFVVEASDEEEAILTFLVDEDSYEKGIRIVEDEGVPIFIWTPASDQLGQHDVTVYASDGNSMNSKTFTITVKAVNHAPNLVELDNKTVNEDEQITFTIEGYDDDGDQIYFFLADGEPEDGSMSLDINTGVFAWTPGQADVGTNHIRVSVHDVYGASNEMTILINVIEVNDPPFFPSIHAQSTNVDRFTTIPLLASDEEGAPITYTLDELSINKGMKIGLDGVQYVEWYPSEENIGTHEITVFASDGEHTVNKTFTLTVYRRNNQPFVSQISNKRAQVGKPLSFTFQASDDDGDPITFSLDEVSIGKGMQVDPLTGVFSWTPLAEHIGINESTLFARDDYNGKSSMSIIISVLEVDNPPVLTPITLRTVDEGDYTSFTINASDPDGAELTFTLDEISTNKGMTVVNGDGNAIVSWQSVQEYVGDNQVTVFARDDNNTVSLTFTLRVFPVNDPPSIVALEDVEVLEDERVNFTVPVTDPDSDTFRFWIDNEASSYGMKIDYLTGEFTWTPGPNNIGGYTVVVFVSDDQDAYTSRTFSLNVIGVNDQPVLSPIDPKEIDEDVTLSFVAVATDEEEEPITYTLDGALDGMTLDAATGAFAWTPTQEQVGEHTITLSASDGNQAVTQTISIRVFPVNDPPVLIRKENLEANEDALISFVVSATDIDSDALSFRLDNTSTSKGMTISGSTGAFTWLPTQSDVGRHEVTITVSDGELTDHFTFIITVNAVNDAPVLGLISSVATKSNRTVSFTATATDEDSPTLSFSIDATAMNKGMTINGNTGVFRWTPGNANIGVHPVTIHVSDGSNTTSKSLEIDVRANKTPVVTVNTGATSSQGERITITAAMLGVADQDNAVEELTFTVTALPNHGKLFIDETALALNGSFKQSQISEGRLRYKHDGLNSASDKFSFTVSDIDGAVTSQVDFPITIDIVLAAEQHADPTISAFPIPTEQEVTVTITNAYRGPVMLSVMDLSGKTLITETASKQDTEFVHKLPVQSMAVGVAVLKVQMAGNSHYIKLIRK